MVNKRTAITMVHSYSDTRLLSNSMTSRAGRANNPVHRRKSSTIVLADDDRNIVDLLADLLEDEGYHVLRASDGQQAWNLCQQHDPSLVITDVMMPRLSGLELVSRLRHGQTARPPVIIMSAVRQTLPAPDVTFLPKPFDLDEMLDHVAASLGSAPDA